MTSLLLLVPLVLLVPCCCQCCWCHCLGHQDSELSCHAQDPLSPRLHCHRMRGKMEWSWDCMGISAVSGIVRFEDFAAVGGGVGGKSYGSLCGWRDGVPGPTAVAAQLPVAAAVGEGQSRVYHLPCCYHVFWGCRLSCHGQRSRTAVTTCAVLLVLPPLFVPVHPPLDVQISGILLHLLCWAEAPLLSCGCFTGYRLKGRQREHLTPP